LVLDFATTVGLKIDGKKPLNISKSIGEADLSSFSLWKLLFYGYTPIFRPDPIMRHWVYGKSHTKEC
jgi:hypothetical protein